MRVTQGVTWHGLSLNVNLDLSHYKGIVPCGLKEYRVTTLQAEGIKTDVHQVINIMKSVAVSAKLWHLE